MISSKKETYISLAVFVLLLIGLIYAIMNAGKPGGTFIKNLTESPTKATANMDTIPQLTEEPGDEKLVKKDVTLGTGVEVKPGDTVTVNYIGTLENGTKFDSSYDAGKPFSFTVGKKAVIRGWDLGLLGMKVGGKRELIIPSELGYGEAGYPPIIPPNATLKFTIELLDTKNIGSEVLNLPAN